jgi:hypothetical protein
MKIPKVIFMFLVDGEPEGRLVGEISNWTGKAFKIPRTLLKESATREELTKAGVYFLFGKSEDDPEESAVYVVRIGVSPRNRTLQTGPLLAECQAWQGI